VLRAQERHDAFKELERKLLELHQVFLDMAVLVEAQGEMLDNIEANVGKVRHRTAAAPLPWVLRRQERAAASLTGHTRPDGCRKARWVRCSAKDLQIRHFLTGASPHCAAPHPRRLLPCESRRVGTPSRLNVGACVARSRTPRAVRRDARVHTRASGVQ
jgi:hypothetical protein